MHRKNHLIQFLKLLLLLAGHLFALSSCTITKLPRDTNSSILTKSACEPPEGVYYYDSLLTQKTDFLIFPTAKAEQRFSPKALAIAQTMGMTSLLNELAGLETTFSQRSPGNRFLFIRQEISEQLILNLLNISTVLAEINCEQQRLLEIRNLLQEKINREVRWLNILSIVVGSVATVISSGVSLAKPNANNFIQGTAIVGGALGGYLALNQIFVNKKIEICQNRNHLADLWNMPVNSTIYPPNLWFSMTAIKNPGDSLTLREKIIGDFRKSGILDPKEKGFQKKKATFFGSKGVYSVDLLTERIDLLEMIATRINLLKYDIKRLQQEVIIQDY